VGSESEQELDGLRKPNWQGRGIAAGHRRPGRRRSSARPHEWKLSSEKRESRSRLTKFTWHRPAVSAVTRPAAQNACSSNTSPAIVTERDRASSRADARSRFPKTDYSIMSSAQTCGWLAHQPLTAAALVSSSGIARAPRPYLSFQHPPMHVRGGRPVIGATRSAFHREW
jgi:hypothetical protein